MNHFELTGEEYKRFCELIYRVAGIRIADNKRVMVSNRVRRRLRNRHRELRGLLHLSHIALGRR